MAGEMFKEEIEPGGEWYDTAQKLKSIAQEAGANDSYVEVFDQYAGPKCVVSKDGEILGSLWITSQDYVYHFERVDGRGFPVRDGEDLEEALTA